MPTASNRVATPARWCTLVLVLALTVAAACSQVQSGSPPDWGAVNARLQAVHFPNGEMDTVARVVENGAHVRVEAAEPAPGQKPAEPHDWRVVARLIDRDSIKVPELRLNGRDTTYWVVTGDSSCVRSAFVSRDARATWFPCVRPQPSPAGPMTAMIRWQSSGGAIAPARPESLTVCNCLASSSGYCPYRPQQSAGPR